MTDHAKMSEKANGRSRPENTKRLQSQIIMHVASLLANPDEFIRFVIGGMVLMIIAAYVVKPENL